MKRTRLISIILVIFMLFDALSPCLNVVFAETSNAVQTNAGSISLGAGSDGTAMGSQAASYVSFGEFNNKLYKAIKNDLKNRNFDFKYDDINRTISINSSALANLTVLNLNYGGINNLEGLSRFTTVTELYLSHNDLSEDSNLSELASMNLTKLDISSNKIADASAIEDLIVRLQETDSIVMGNQVCEIVQAVQINDGEHSNSVTTTKFDLPQILTLASNVKPHWERIEFVSEDMHGTQPDPNDNSQYSDYYSSVTGRWIDDMNSYYVLTGNEINNADDVNNITVNDMPIYVTKTNNKITLNIGAYYKNGEDKYSYKLKRGMLHFRIKIVDDQTEAAQANNTNKASTNLLHDSIFDMYFIVHDDATNAVILKDSNLYRAIKNQLKCYQEENSNLASYKYEVDENGQEVYDIYYIETIPGTHYMKLIKDGESTPSYLYNGDLNKLFRYVDGADISSDDKIEQLEPAAKKVVEDHIYSMGSNGQETSIRVYKIPHEGERTGRYLYRAAYDDAKAFVIPYTDLLNEITNLKLNNKQIRDLTGIEGFYGISLYLDLSHNYLESIEPLVKIMETKAERESALQSEYNRVASSLRAAYEAAKANVQTINSISDQIKADQETLKNLVLSAAKTEVPEDATKAAEAESKLLSNAGTAMGKLADKWYDDFDDEGKLKTIGYYTKLYGYHDGEKNNYNGAYEELRSNLETIYKELGILYRAVYKDEYKLTNILSDGLNYQDVIEYEEYLKKTEGFDDVEATYETAKALYDEEVSYIGSLETNEALSDFDKAMFKKVYPGIDFYAENNKTPISTYLNSKTFDNRFEVVKAINNIRKIAIYSQMASYCLIKRISSYDIATNNCFAEEFLTKTIEEKQENQINCDYESRMLTMLQTGDKSISEDIVDVNLYDLYKDYENKEFYFSTYTAGISKTTDEEENEIVNTISLSNGQGGASGDNILATFPITTIKKGSSIQLENIVRNIRGNRAIDRTNNRAMDATVSGMGTDSKTNITNGLLTVDPEETATSLTITVTIGSDTYNLTVNVGDETEYLTSNSYKLNCKGVYKEEENLAIDVKESNLDFSKILTDARASQAEGKTYFEGVASQIYNNYVSNVYNGLNLKDLVIINDGGSTRNKGINETEDDATSSRINAKNNMSVYTQLMSLVSKLVNGNVAKYITIPKLVDLDISYNAELSDISAITAINTLTKLNAEYDYVANVDQVDWSQLPAIRELNLGFNFITDITPLTKLKHLRSLILRHNLLETVPIMADDYKSLFRYLKELDLSDNRITDLTPLIVYLEHITNGDYANYLANNNDGIVLRLGGQKIELDAGTVYLNEHPEVFDYELPKIFTQLQAIDVNRTSYGINSENGRIESEGTYVTLPTRTAGEKEGTVCIQHMPSADTCVGEGTTATIKYNVEAERIGKVTLNPSGTIAVEKGSSKKFSVGVEDIDPNSVTITWEIEGNNSRHTTISDGELIIDENETAPSITVIANVIGGKIAERLTTTVLVAEKGALPVDPDPEEPTTPTAKMTPENTSQIAKGSSKEYTIDCSGFKGEGFSEMSVEWALSGKTSENTTMAEPTSIDFAEGNWGSKTTISVATDETAETMTLTAVVKWKEGTEEKSETLTNTITIVAEGTPDQPDTPESKIRSVTVTPHGTIEIEKGKSREFVVTMDRLEGYDTTKGVDISITGNNGSLDANTKLRALSNSSFSLTVSSTETNDVITIKVTSVEDPTKFDTVTVNVKNPGEANPEHPTANITLGYTVSDGTNLTSVLPKTPVSDFKAKLVNNSNDYVVVVKKDGTTITSGDISTGATVEIQDKNGHTLKDLNGKLYVYDVVVKGDINGDSRADSLDSLLIKAHRMEVSRLIGAQALAADIDGDGDIDLDDARLLLYHRAEVNGYVFNYR